MAQEFVALCKDCGVSFGYSENSLLAGGQRGLARPERCPACRRVHSRESRHIGAPQVAARPTGPRKPDHELQPGRLGKLDHPERIHRRLTIQGKFGRPGSGIHFGITDDDIRRLIEAMQRHQVTVVVGPTGSGKSTFLPYRLMAPPDGIEADVFTRHGQILITQPRIQATRNIARFVARDLHGSSLGPGFDVGFRHHDAPESDWRNKLVYATDGTLINWITDGQIANLSVIMIDEAHERSLNIDLILGLLKVQLPRFPHLRLIIASATINAALFQDYFGGPERVALLTFQGLKQHRIDAFFPFYDFPLRNDGKVAAKMADKAIEVLLAIAEGEKPEGDILGFLDGAGSIDNCVRLLQERIAAQPSLQERDIKIFPLHTKLDLEEQDKALAPKTRATRDRVLALLAGGGPPPERIVALLLDPQAAEETGRLVRTALDEKGLDDWTVTVPPPDGTGVDSVPRQVICTTHERFRGMKTAEPFTLVCDQRVVISTNLAETSLTVDGVVYVIDSGLIKESRWDPGCSASELVPIFHSRAGCRQRWGRAGRVRSGEAHMLYTDAQFEDERVFPAHTVPEIQRSALEQVVLNAKAAGVDDISRFVWIQPPPKEELTRAPAALTAMGALDADGDLTATGAELQTLATKIPIARLLVTADCHALGLEMATLAALAPLRVQGDLLCWDKRWDFPTRHAVAAIHRDLAAACRDDLDFWFKLYSIWAEASDPKRQSDLCRLFFIHRENFEEKVAAARRKLLELLGTGKKSEEDRPLRLSSLDRMRMILAATLAEDTFYQTGPDGSIGCTGTDAAKLPMEIDEASVCAAPPPPHFVALAKRIVSGRDGRRKLVLSGLVAIEPGWVALRTASPLEFACKMAVESPAGDAASDGQGRGRLMLDVAYLHGGCYRLKQDTDRRVRIDDLVHMPEPLVPVMAADRFADLSSGEVEGPSDSDPLAGWETPPRQVIGEAEESAGLLPVLSPEETAPDADEPDDGPVETARSVLSAGRLLNPSLLETGEWTAAAQIEPILEGLPTAGPPPWSCRVAGYDLSGPGRPAVRVTPVTAAEAQAPIQDKTRVPGERVTVIPIELIKGDKEETALRVRLVDTGEEHLVDARELSFAKRYGLVQHYLGQPFKMAVCLRDGVARLTRLPINEAALHAFFSNRPATIHCRLLERFGSEHHLRLEEPALEDVVEGAFMSYDPKKAQDRRIFDVGQTYDLHPDAHYAYADEHLTVKPEGLDELIGQTEYRGRIFWEPFRKKLHVTRPMDGALLELLLALSAGRDYQTSVFRLYRHSNSIRVRAKAGYSPLEYGCRASKEAFLTDVRPDYQPGERLRGRVSAIFPKRVMVVLERGGTGSIGPKHLAWITPADPREVVYPDQRLEVTVVGTHVDPKDKALLDLSLLDPAAFPNDRYARDKVMAVTIRELRGSYAMTELQPGLFGRLAAEDIRHGIVDKVGNCLRQGERRLARIIGVKLKPVDPRYPIEIKLSTKDVYQEIIAVRRECLKSLIGPGGATIRRLNEMTDCRLWVDMDKSTVAVSSWREEQIRVAKVLIRKVEAENWQPEGVQEHRQAQPAVPGPAPARTQVVQARVMIPEKKIGLLIGKKHATIKQLQEKSGCRIQYGQDGSVRITGSSEQNTARAMELIRILIPETSNKVG